MSLKCYKNDKVQDFLKQGSASILFGIQRANPTKLLSIYNAFESSALSITSITAIKYDINKNEISRAVLETDLITYEAVTDQYLTDITKLYYLISGIYTIEFVNSSNTFKTEPFLVEESLIGDSMTFLIDTTAAAATQNITIHFTGTVYIYWGDGTTQEFTSGVNIAHYYSGMEIYTAIIYGDLTNITRFDSQSGRIKTISNFKTGILTNISITYNQLNSHLDLSQSLGLSGTLNVTQNSPYGGVTNFRFPNQNTGNLSTIDLNSNTFSNLDLSMFTLSGSINLRGCSNLISVIYPTSGNGIITNFYTYLTKLSPYDFTDFPTSNSIDIDMKDCNWTATETDNQLIYLNTTGWINGTLDISGNNASRTAASNTAYNALVANGWSITVN